MDKAVFALWWKSVSTADGRADPGERFDIGAIFFPEVWEHSGGFHHQRDGLPAEFQTYPND